MKKKDFFTQLHKTFGTAGLIWLLVLLVIVGGVGGLIVNRIFLPYLAQISLINDVSLVDPDAPFVINRREEVIIEDGVNQLEVANRVRDSLVFVYEHQGEFDSGNFRVLNAFPGVVMTSDGLIAVPETLLSPNLNLTVVVDNFSETAEVVGRDEFTGAAFLKIDRESLTIPRQGFSQEIQPAEKLLMVRLQEGAGQTFIKPLQAVNNNQLEPSLLTTYRLDQLNRGLAVDSDFPEEELGAGVFDRDSQFLGMVLSPNEQRQVVLAQDLQLALDNFLDDEEIIWPDLNLTYQILGPGQTRLFNLPREHGVLLKSNRGQLLIDDFVYEVAGREITAQVGFQDLVYSNGAGELLILKLIRDGEEKVVELQL